MSDTKKIAASELLEQQEERRIKPWMSVWLRLWENPSARVGGFLAVVMVGISLLVPILDGDYDARRDRDLRARYSEPDCIIGALAGTNEEGFTCEHPFGTDKNGRDIMRRVGHGMFVSLSVGVFVVVLSTSIGSAIGLISGYLGGWVDSVTMRLIDILLAFPSLLLAIAIVSVAGPSLTNGMLAIAITQIPIFARLSRSTAISIRSAEYVLSARALGAGSGRIILNHVLPNSFAPLLVQATLLLGTAVVETAALGFLGLGQQPPFPELGKMLAESQQSLASGKWWVMVFPGVAIVLIVLGFNLLGDAFRDALDPRLRGT